MLSGCCPLKGEDFEVLTDMLAASAVNYCVRFDKNAPANVLACGYLLKASFEQTGRTVTVGELSAVIESFLASYRTTPSVVREDKIAASKPDYLEFEMAVDSMKNWCKR